MHCLIRTAAARQAGFPRQSVTITKGFPLDLPRKSDKAANSLIIIHAHCSTDCTAVTPENPHFLPMHVMMALALYFHRVMRCGAKYFAISARNDCGFLCSLERFARLSRQNSDTSPQKTTEIMGYFHK